MLKTLTKPQFNDQSVHIERMFYGIGDLFPAELLSPSKTIFYFNTFTQSNRTGALV